LLIVQNSPGANDERVDPVVVLREEPMSWAQKVGVLTTVVVTAADGYDLLAASFASSGFGTEWRLTHSTLGMILAMNLAGMGLGTLFVSPIADRIGRRATVMPCLVIVALAMFGAGVSRSAQMLAATRFITGIGIGGMVGATLALATEYSNNRNKPLALALLSIGVPLGGILGGALAPTLLSRFGWRAIFFSGGIITLMMAAIAMLFLMESLDFLINRGEPGDLQKANAVFARYGRESMRRLPTRQAILRPGLARLFGRPMRATAGAMALVNFFQMTTIFYFLLWLPQLVVDMGFSAAEGARVSLVQNMLGVLGALTVGMLGRKVPIVLLTALALVATGASVWAFALAPPGLLSLKVGAGVEGFLSLGSVAGIYAILARAFPAALRATGSGFAVTIGRLGSVVASVVPGLLFTHGWHIADVSAVMAGIIAVAACVLWLWASSKRGVGDKVNRSALA
jgi:MFS family permease